MAFRLNTSFAGIEIPNAYARFEGINGDKNNLDMQMVFYANQQACLDGSAPFNRVQFSFMPDMSDGAPNYHKQAYEIAKTKPEFDGATDVI